MIPELKHGTGGTFRPVGARQPSPLFRDRPREETQYLRFADSDGFECFVHARAARQMADGGRQASPHEVMGRLAGRACLDGKGAYVLVEHAVPFSQARSGSGYVLADHEAQSAGRKEFDRSCRPFDSIGWWHTHPNSLGLFYSPTDRDNQSAWSDPNSVGIVLDPDLKGDGLKVFRGPTSIELQAVRDPAQPDMMRKIRDHTAPRLAPPEERRLPHSTVPSHEPICRYPGPRHAARERRRAVGLAVAVSLASVAIVLSIVTHVLLWSTAMTPATPKGRDAAATPSLETGHGGPSPRNASARSGRPPTAELHLPAARPSPSALAKPPEDQTGARPRPPGPATPGPATGPGGILGMLSNLIGNLPASRPAPDRSQLGPGSHGPASQFGETTP